MSTTPVNSLNQLVFASSTPQTRPTSTNFYEVLKETWANALDKQAEVLKEKSASINQEGNDTPGELIKLTAEASKFTVMSNSASTSLKDAAEGQKTLASR